MARRHWQLRKHSATFVGSCVDLPERPIMDMQYKATEITRKTFLSYVDKEAIQASEKGLGYHRVFSMANDWAVNYYKSYYGGQPCVYFRHSSIEHVFFRT